MTKIIQEDTGFRGKTYKEIRRLHSVNQLIKKFVTFDKTTTNSYFFIKGTAILNVSNNSPFIVEVKMQDAPVLSSIPYLEIDTLDSFRWLEDNKNANGLVWDDGSFNLNYINFDDGEIVEPYHTECNIFQVKKSLDRYKSVKSNISKYKTVVMYTNDKKVADTNNNILYIPELLEFQNYLGLYPSTKIGFCKSAEEPFKILNEMSTEEFNNSKIEDNPVLTCLHMPKKFLMKLEKSDKITIAIKQVTLDRFMLIIKTTSNRYNKTQIMEFVSPF